MLTASAAVRIIELPSGTLVGWKAAPGPDCKRLFEHALSFHNVPDLQESPVTDWSAIYVQLDVAQAIRYVPNQV